MTATSGTSLGSREMNKRALSVTSTRECPLHIVTVAESDRASITEGVVPTGALSVAGLHAYPLPVAIIAEPPQATITDDAVPKSLRRRGGNEEAQLKTTMSDYDVVVGFIRAVAPPF